MHSVHPKTLRGVFPERPVPHKRNFIRENVLAVRAAQAAELRTKSMPNAQIPSKAMQTVSLTKLKSTENAAVKKIAPKVHARRPKTQKIEHLDLRQGHISDSIVQNNVTHRSMQTTPPHDEQMPSVTVIAPPAPPEIAGRRRCMGNGSGDTTEGGHAAPPTASPTVKETPLDMAESNNNVFRKINYIRNNILNAGRGKKGVNKTPHNQNNPSNQSNLVISTQNNQANNVPPTQTKAPPTKQMQNKQVQEVVEMPPDCPPGHVVLPEDERQETLRLLRESYAEKIEELNSLPVRSDTLRMQRRKIELEEDLKKLDEGIKIFQLVQEVDSQESQSKLRKLLYKRIRILSWLPSYTKMCFLQDVVAGVTVGLTLIPQSIAYASIAELPPHVGLHTAIMGSFAYIIFGTIKQVSIGPSSILSLLTYTYVHGRGMDYVILLTFLAGCLEMLMGLCNLGVVVDFIPAPVTSAFTSATALVIILAQFKNIFGIRFKNNGIFDLIIKLFTHVKDLSIPDTVLGFGSMLFLVVIKRVSAMRFANPRTNKALWFLGICRNAITVILGSFVAYIYMKYTGTQCFKLAGEVKPGLPVFKPPAFGTTGGVNGTEVVTFSEMIHTLGYGIIVVPVVATLANVAIAKKFSDGTVFDAAQEMIALGASNILGSFVGSMPTTGAFTRSAVNDASHVQTPMGGLYAGTMIILALSYLTPLFELIPKATIAAVLICAVFFMIEYQELPKLWRNNKFDFWIGLGTFLISLYLGVEIGLAIGSCFALVKLMQFWARPKVFAEVRSSGKDNEYLLIKPELGFYYPAAGYFRQEILKIANRNKEIPIVLDFRTIISIDYTACQAVKEIVGVFKDDRKLILLNLDPEVYRRLKSVINLDDLDIRDDVGDGHINVLPDARMMNETEIPLLQQNMIQYNNEFELANNHHNRKSWYDNDTRNNDVA